MDDLKNIEFISYCIEIYKGHKNIDGAQAYTLLKNTGAIEYINANFEALHTFGDDYLVWNIDEFLKNHSVGNYSNLINDNINAELSVAEP